MTKATHTIREFDFDYEGAAVALVGPAVGSGANSRKVLLTKSANQITTEDITKASQVTVTLPITEYLRRFFDIWYEDAEILARVFGYTTESSESTESYDEWYNEYINEKVAAVSIMKSLVVDKTTEETQALIASLSPKDYLEIIKSQEVFEKNFEITKSKGSNKKSSDKEGVTVPSGAISPSVDINKQKPNKEDVMSDFISKSAHETALQEAINKALAPVQVELTKAAEIIKQFETEKAQAVAKSRKEAIAAVEADKDAAEELFKSLEKIDQSAFEAVIKALGKKQDKVESSDLLKEVGSEGNSEAVEKAVGDSTKVGSRTAEILKQQFNQGNK